MSAKFLVIVFVISPVKNERSEMKILIRLKLFDVRNKKNALKSQNSVVFLPFFVDKIPFAKLYIFFIFNNVKYSHE